MGRVCCLGMWYVCMMFLVMYSVVSFGFPLFVWWCLMYFKGRFRGCLSLWWCFKFSVHLFCMYFLTFVGWRGRQFGVATGIGRNFCLVWSSGFEYGWILGCGVWIRWVLYIFNMYVCALSWVVFFVFMCGCHMFMM